MTSPQPVEGAVAPEPAPRQEQRDDLLLDAERWTTYRWGHIWVGALLAVAGAVVMSIQLTREGLWTQVSSDVVLGLFGWWPPLIFLKGPMLALLLHVSGAAKVALGS